MTREEAVEKVSRWLDKGTQHSDSQFGYIEGWFTKEDEQAFQMAIEALEFMEKYDAVWEEIKCAGEHGREIEFHRYGRVYRIREVAT